MKKEKLFDSYLTNDWLDSSYVKAGKIIIIGVVTIYLMGHLFKICAFTVNGFKQLKSSLNAKS